MGVLFVAGVGVAYWAEARATRCVHALGVERRQHGGQGGPLRLAHSALFAIVTTAASCGAVNAMHDSFMPLGGLVPLINMQLGEVIVGGVGAASTACWSSSSWRSSSPA